VISVVNKMTDNIIDYPFFLVVKWCFGCKIGKIRYILIPTLCFFFRKSSDSKSIDLLVTGCVSGRTARTDVSIYMLVYSQYTYSQLVM